MAINQDQIIHWVSGKGGVGKSTVAASQAIALARNGFKTLLVELGEKSFYRFLFDTNVQYEPVDVAPNLSIALWEGEQCLREYLLYLLKLESIVHLFFENRVMKALVQAAPGLRELALVGKITSGIRGIGKPLPFDRIVVDGYSSGHFRALIEAPRAMAKAIPFGPMGEQSRAVDQVLCSNKNCRYWVVATPEELPVTEGLELCDFLRSNFDASAEVVMNRWIVPPVSRDELKAMPETDFTVYLAELLDRQQRLEEQIHSSVKSARRLPYSWEATPRERLNRLSTLWGADWK